MSAPSGMNERELSAFQLVRAFMLGWVLALLLWAVAAWNLR